MNMRGLIPLIGFICLIGAFAIGLTRDPRLLPSELIDQPFPEFKLENLAGDSTLTKDDLLGQVSLINIFGSWCVSCAIEHPHLMQLSRRSDIRLIGVDWRDTRPDAERWLARHGNPYDTIIYDQTSTLIVDLGVAGAPESFIIDKMGQIRYKHVGVLTPDDWEKTLLPIITELNAQ